MCLLRHSKPTPYGWNCLVFLKAQYHIVRLSPQQSDPSSLSKQVHQTIMWDLLVLQEPNHFFFILRLQITSHSLPIHFPFRFSPRIFCESFRSGDGGLKTIMYQYVCLSIAFALLSLRRRQRRVQGTWSFQGDCVSLALRSHFHSHSIDALRKNEELHASFTEKACCPLQTTADDCRRLLTPSLLRCIIKLKCPRKSCKFL
jgi:hypothetical protein